VRCGALVVLVGLVSMSGVSGDWFEVVDTGPIRR
jgi:hypothetical protein